MRDELNWLAGFIDGEGCFALIHYKTGQIKPVFEIGNTSVDNMRRLKAAVSQIVAREVRYKLAAKPSRRSKRPHYYLWVARQEELKKLCTALLPLVTGKRPQIEVMLEYLAQSPLARGATHNPHVPRGSGYLASNYELVAKMRHLNRKFADGEWASSQQETERPAPASGEETIRATSQDVEAPGN